jgi:HD-GYP domain-containing protein (c-di-GMP phosphodiesterase class II)
MKSILKTKYRKFSREVSSNMKLVTVEDLKDGDVLASDVLLEDYTVVLTKGTIIKEQYINKLRELEIFTVYIEDEAPEEKAEEKSEEKPKEKPKPKTKKAKSKAKSKLAPEQITFLRSDVKDEVQSKLKDILELHIYQQNKGLEKIAEEAKTIIADVLEEDAVVEKIYDVKERNADIYEHSIQVCTIATLIALKMGLDKEEVYDISVSSLIHDLGLRYLVVKYENQDINLLPNKDQEEYKKHTIYGYTAIKNETWLSNKAKEIVLNHHERIDGSGYPLGTSKLSIPTQIVGVCDEFDELICGVGKAGVRVHEAINCIRNYSGIWFNAYVVDMFLQLIAVYPVGSKVITNKGEMGIVMKQNLHFPERPIIKIMKDRFGQPIRTEKIVDLIKETTVVIQEVIK